MGSGSQEPKGYWLKHTIALRSFHYGESYHGFMHVFCAARARLRRYIAGVDQHRDRSRYLIRVRFDFSFVYLICVKAI